MQFVDQYKKDIASIKQKLDPRVQFDKKSKLSMEQYKAALKNVTDVKAWPNAKPGCGDIAALHKKCLDEWLPIVDREHPLSKNKTFSCDKTEDMFF